MGGGVVPYVSSRVANSFVGKLYILFFCLDFSLKGKL